MKKLFLFIALLFSLMILREPGAKALNSVTTSTATFAWNAEIVTVSGYNLYWGTIAGMYSPAVNCGNVLSYQLTGLPLTGPLYVTVTAYQSATATTPYVESPQAPPLTIYSLSVSSDANSTVSPSGTVWSASGGSQTFAVTPKTGYVSVVNVDGVLIGAVTSGSYQVSNVSANHVISIISMAQIPAVSGLSLKAGQ